MSRTAYNLLTGMETLTDDINEDSLDGEVENDLLGFSAELYDILCQACSGETLSLVRGVEDMLGATAWYKLYKKYNPRTMARAIRLVGAVTNPPKI